MNTNPRNPTGDEHTTASEERREEIAIRNSVCGLRRRRGLSQRQLADALSIGDRTVGRLEDQDYLPSLELAYRTANFFGLPLQEVFFQKTPPSTEDAAFPKDDLEDARVLEGEPAQAEILSHLLDHGTVDERRLEQDLALLDDDVRGHLSALEEASLLRIAREPGGIFGLGGSRWRACHPPRAAS